MQNRMSTGRSEEKHVLCWALFQGMQIQYRTVKKFHISTGHSKKLKVEVLSWTSIQT